ncbi:MAG: uroporphyrinogen-III C-methyltransferase [bacterium]
MTEDQPSGKGKVYLVGAGPGDPGLLTIRAANALKESDVVIYDYLINLALLEYTSTTSEKVFVGKPRQRDRKSQDEIQELMIRKARQGKRVVRLKGGDPFIFGRGGEEVLALTAAGIDWEVVPGVSSGHAVPAYAGIPLTHRDMASSVAFVTGHERKNKTNSVDWNRLAAAVDTLVIFMGAGNLPHVVTVLVEAGRPSDTPIAIIENGTSENVRVLTATLATILKIVGDGKIKTPALIVVGKVVALHKKLFRWSKVRQFLLEKENVEDDSVFSCVS